MVSGGTRGSCIDGLYNGLWKRYLIPLNAGDLSSKGFVQYGCDGQPVDNKRSQAYTVLLHRVRGWDKIPSSCSLISIHGLLYPGALFKHSCEDIDHIGS